MKGFFFLCCLLATSRLCAQSPKITSDSIVKPRLMLTTSHFGPITIMKFFNHDKHLVTAGMDNMAKVWNIESGRLIANLIGHSDFINSVSISPDGKMGATASSDHSVKIWDLEKGELKATLNGHKAQVSSAEFSPDGTQIVSTSFDHKAIIWNVKTNKVAGILYGHETPILSAKYTLDGKHIITISSDGEMKLWNPLTYEYILTFEHPQVSKESLKDLEPRYLNDIVRYKELISFDLSPDGKKVISSCYSSKVVQWEIEAGKAIMEFSGRGVIFSAEFSSNGKWISAISDNDKVVIWDSFRGHEWVDISYKHLSNVRFGGNGEWLLLDNAFYTTVFDVNKKKFNKDTLDIVLKATSADGTRVAGTNWESNGIVVIRIPGNKQIAKIIGQSSFTSTARFNSKGNRIMTSNTQGIFKMLEADNGTKNLVGKQSGWVVDAKYIDEDKKIFVYTDNGDAAVRDAANGKILYSIEGGCRGITNDGSKVLVNEDTLIKILDVSGQMVVAEFKATYPQSFGYCSAFSSDGGKIVASTSDGKALVYDINNGRLLSEITNDGAPLDGSEIQIAEFSPVDDGILLCTEKGTCFVYSQKRKEIIQQFDASNQGITSAEFGPDGSNILTSSHDNVAKVWFLSSYIGYKYDVAYRLNHPSGVRTAHFDSNQKMIVTSSYDHFFRLWDTKSLKNILSWTDIDSVNWMVLHPSGLFDASPGAMDKLYYVQGMDIIELSQLKTRYYEPGLWRKIMSGEKLRDVAGMKAIDLPPGIKVGQVDDKGNLIIELTNRGGGIGPVSISIFGKEIVNDARPTGADPNAPTMKISYNVGDDGRVVKGENVFTVKSWNMDHWVESRGAEVLYSTKQKESYPPSVYILTIGVSDYTGTEIDLRFAAKDADDVSKALQLGANKLFGTQKSYTYNLTTTQDRDLWPTKKNILKAFEKISITARPLDVVVVYFSGHGINIGGPDGDWHYLTQDAYTANPSAYNDPAILEQTTLSSNSLVELFKKIPAAKQVLMIDACASGKVVENLMTKKDIASSTVRALDRMKDRTGMHIITGCTADAVSYEASRYGQGVLTYSILEGIRGAALRDDQFIDVNKLFQYAQDRVPVLAAGIGGIQSPMIFSPNGSQSFDFGQLGDVEKKGIPIAKIRPVYIRSNFQDENQMEDVEELGNKVDQALNEEAARGDGATIIFVDVRKYPDGCRLAGRYKKVGAQLLLKLVRQCEGRDEANELVADDVNGLVQMIINLIESK